ncbi:MAG: c-type cytochrome [bacterium JZ-2024 1]
MRGKVWAVIFFILLGMATRTPAEAQEGKAIYEKVCKTCHGKTGMSDEPTAKALKPIPFLLADWQTLERWSDAYLKQVIMKGKSSTFTKQEGFVLNEMPSFKKEGLTLEQVKGLVKYVRAIQKEKPPATEEGMNKFNSKFPDVVPLFQKHCERCHGKYGDGNGPDIEKARKEKKDLQPLPPDYRNDLFMNRFTDDTLEKIIFEGRKNVTVGGKVSPMAGFGNQVGEKNIGDLIAYIRSLAKANKEASAKTTQKAR